MIKTIGGIVLALVIVIIGVRLVASDHRAVIFHYRSADLQTFVQSRALALEIMFALLVGHRLNLKLPGQGFPVQTLRVSAGCTIRRKSGAFR